MSDKATATEVVEASNEIMSECEKLIIKARKSFISSTKSTIKSMFKSFYGVDVEVTDEQAINHLKSLELPVTGCRCD